MFCFEFTNINSLLSNLRIQLSEHFTFPMISLLVLLLKAVAHAPLTPVPQMLSVVVLSCVVAVVYGQDCSYWCRTPEDQLYCCADGPPKVFDPKPKGENINISKV